MAELTKDQKLILPVIAALINDKPLGPISRFHVAKVLIAVNNIPEEEVEKLIED